MIQRIQSIFLFLASGSFLALFGIPFAKSESAMTGIFEDKVYNIFDHPVLIALVAIGGLLSILAIFLFKNRKLQIKMGYGIITISVLLVIVILLLIIQDNTSGQVPEIKEGLGIGMPVLAIIFGLLANRSIKKDDKLVKSMDRLR